MKLVPILVTGSKFRIYAVDISDREAVEHCPAKAFLATMSSTSSRSIHATLRFHSEHGPIHNEEKSRKLSTHIYEFKTPQGDRLYYFYLEGRLSVLTHGSRKPTKSLVKREVEKAQDIMDRYIQWRGSQ